MNIFYVLLIVNAFYELNCLELNDSEAPLNVTVTEIGTNYSIFNITGSSTLYGLPVVDISINYSVDPNSVKSVNSNVNTFYESGNGTFQQMVKIVDLMAGHKYHFHFAAVNSKKQVGPPSKDVAVLLRPDTPDISIQHPQKTKIIVLWGESQIKSEDFFLLTVEKV